MAEKPVSQSARKPSRRVSDLSVIAPVFGFVLLIPPIIGLFATDGTVLGAPTVLVYLFAVWLGLILCAAYLGQALGRSEAERRDTS